jgi:hypothetical protein
VPVPLDNGPYCRRIPSKPCDLFEVDALMRIGHDVVPGLCGQRAARAFTGSRPRVALGCASGRSTAGADSLNSIAAGSAGESPLELS